MAPLDRQAVSSYLATVFGRPVELLALRPLKDAHDAAAEDPKGFGYGGPLEVECVVDGALHRLVISRTRPTQGFGHDYPADRAWQALYGHHAYNEFPRHVRSVDVASVRDTGEIVSVANAGEFIQLVEKADGTLYWLDLDRLLTAPLRPLDIDRARALGRTRSSGTSPRSTPGDSASWWDTASASWAFWTATRTRIPSSRRRPARR